ncbi:MAG: M50 family metallopeptidase [Clostridia bacterium]
MILIYTILTIILTILVFSLLIIIHELGHFATAKLSGVQVNEFWLGMGPTILKKTYKDTTYMLKAFPFGGAVVMEGEDGGSTSAKSFGKAKKFNRAIILVAGAFMNFVLGFVIILLLSMPIKQVASTTIESFADGFTYSSELGLLENDTFLQIDDTKIRQNNDILLALNINIEQIYDITVLRDGEKVFLESFELKPATFVDDGVESYRYGLNFAIENMSIFDRLSYALDTSLTYAKLVWLGLEEMVSGNVSVDDMSGPVGITVMIGEAASVSMATMWNFVAFISINLGVMNLLPLPALDGGRLLLLFVEAIRRKPLNPKIEGYVHGAGLLILLTFMVYVTFNDVFVKILG